MSNRYDANALAGALLGAVETMARSIGSWTVRRPDRLTFLPHRYAASVQLRPLTHPDDRPAFQVTSRIDLGEGVDPERYLALLARHVRRQDAQARLVLENDGTLASLRDHLLLADPDGPTRVEEIVDAVVLQAVQAEFLVREAEADGLLEPEHHPTRPSPGPVLDRRPNALMALAAGIGREGVRRMATVGLTGESKLGPWFVGTEQDAVLEARMRAGWRRVPDATRHEVVVHAPDDEEVLATIRVVWAHASPLLGPAVLLVATTREPLGRDASGRLRTLNGVGGVTPDRGRVGLWLPEGWATSERRAVAADVPWRPSSALETELAMQRPAWVTVAPTAWARPGALARLWRWAEFEAVRARRPHALN